MKTMFHLGQTEHIAFSAQLLLTATAKKKTMLLSTTALYTNAISAVNGVGDFDDLHAWSAS